MLKKEDMVPGLKVKLLDNLRDGITSSIFKGRKQENLEYISMWVGGIGPMTSKCIRIFPREEVTVIRKPRRIEGINVIEIQYKEFTGYVYWCEFRVSTGIV